MKNVNFAIMGSGYRERGEDAAERGRGIGCEKIFHEIKIFFKSVLKFAEEFVIILYYLV